MILLIKKDLQYRVALVKGQSPIDQKQIKSKIRDL